MMKNEVKISAIPVEGKECSTQQFAKMNTEELTHILGGFLPVSNPDPNCNAASGCALGCKRECKQCKDGCQSSSKEGFGGGGVIGPIHGGISTEI